MAKKKKKLPDQYQQWVDARKKFHLGHAHVQMARELGLNPRKFGSLANHDQQPWKAPLPQFIEHLYQKRFGRKRPEEIRSIEEIYQAKLKNHAKQKAYRKEKKEADKREMLRTVPIIDFSAGRWRSKPATHSVTPDMVTIVTQPKTDLWQRTYYGFQRLNAHCLLVPVPGQFTFRCHAAFDYREQYDQCGLVLYLDSNHWFKASVEYETPEQARLGSVLTTLGHSDWASTDIATPQGIWFQLSRRGPDFRLESSLDGEHFQQLRIFHLHPLGETTNDMGGEDQPLTPRPQKSLRFGLYACSPGNSSFTATFSRFSTTSCAWARPGIAQKDLDRSPPPMSE